MSEKKNLVKSILLSIFDEDGPTPVICWPDDLPDTSRLIIAMKTISLLMGDSVYQSGEGTEGINYFGILPFPDLGLNGLTYFFLIADEEARGQAKAATITMLIDEKNNSFFYTNMKYLRILLDKAATSIQDTSKLDDYDIIMEGLREDLFEFTKEIKDPFSTRRKIKVIFAGLDRAGKTSFRLGVQGKFSEIIKSLPTKGVERSEEKIFDEQSSQISIWDLGGQKKYREKYLEQSKIYLYNVDLLFYIIDIQDTKRLELSLGLFKNIVETLKEYDEYPPIVVCLNKFDPDISDSEEIINNIVEVTKTVEAYSDKFFVKISKTSVFVHWTLISAYSYGLSQLSPNREVFKNQLMNLAKKTDAGALLLLNENGIILSNYSKDEISGKVFEISAPHFQTLYKTFKEFKILKKDFIVSSGITDESKKLIFKRIKVDKYDLYLLFLIEKYISIEKIEDNLPDFSKNLTELIKTYI